MNENANSMKCLFRLAIIFVAAAALSPKNDVVAAAFHDKKVRRGEIRCALPRALGAMGDRRGDYGIPVSTEELLAALKD